jgi:hypothetical protein
MKRVMKKHSFIIILILLISFIPLPSGSETPDMRIGDIIFHESWSVQGKAVKYMTGDKYSHAGIVIKYNNRFLILEAAARIKVSKLQTFVKRGVGRHFIVKRLKDYDRLINKKSLIKLKRTARRMIGKRYDYFFEWDDRMIYSAELIWKIFYRGLGVKLCGFRRLGSFDLSHPFISFHMDQKFGDDIPFNEPVVTPEMLFNSSRLFTVYEN